MDLYFSMKDLFRVVPEPTTVSKIVIQRPLLSSFDLELRQRWKEALENGICRYQLKILRNDIMRGKYGFILQASRPIPYGILFIYKILFY